MGRGGWWATAHKAAKSQMWLKQLSMHMLFIYLFVQQIFLKHLWCVWFCMCTGTAKDLGALCLFYPPYSFLAQEKLMSELSPNWPRGSPITPVLCSWSPTLPRGSLGIFHGAEKKRMSRWPTLLLYLGVLYKNGLKDRNFHTHRCWDQKRLNFSSALTV